MSNITRTEVIKVMKLIKTGQYNLAREMAIARRKLTSYTDGGINDGEMLDDAVIAIALECLINRL